MKPNDNIIRTPHFPETAIAVEIPDTMFSQGVRVYFSNFSVPKGTKLIKGEKPLRGIANVSFIIPEGYDIELNDKGIYLRVYLPIEEKEKDIYVLKGKANEEPEWVNIGGEYDEDEFYLIANIPLGDPPIAVG